MSATLNDNIHRYLSIISEIKKSHQTYDLHLHPVEIVSNILNYKAVPHENGLYALDGERFVPPTLENLPTEQCTNDIMALLKKRPKMIPLLTRRIYRHTGPGVFQRYLDLLCIDKGLLLPVAPANGRVDAQISVTLRMFKGESRFSLSGSVPNEIKNQDVKTFLEKEREKYQIIAVKIHPGVTAINLETTKGKERVECILEASAGADIPVIIHAGYSYVPNKDASAFGLISNLSDMNLKWPVPVILAHGGAYGFSSSEVLQDVMPILNRLLDSHDNLFIDFSGLGHETLILLLANVEVERMLFGSDALYSSPVLILAQLMYALEKCKLEPENYLVQVMSENPARYVFRESPLITSLSQYQRS